MKLEIFHCFSEMRISLELVLSLARLGDLIFRLIDLGKFQKFLLTGGFVLIMLILYEGETYSSGRKIVANVTHTELLMMFLLYTFYHDNYGNEPCS